MDQGLWFLEPKRIRFGLSRNAIMLHVYGADEDRIGNVRLDCGRAPGIRPGAQLRVSARRKGSTVTVDQAVFYTPGYEPDVMTRAPLREHKTLTVSIENLITIEIKIELVWPDLDGDAGLLDVSITSFPPSASSADNHRGQPTHRAPAGG